MTISTAAKLGGGAVVAAGTPASIYFSWDHITLYAVEREVINKDLKFTVENPTGSDNKQITIKAPDSSESNSDPKLDTGNSWSCIITIQPKTEGGTVTATNLVSKLKEALPDKDDSSISDTARKNKELLVKVCSKHRKDGHSNSSIQGELNIKEQTTGDSFKFEEDPDLNVLLGSN